MSRIFFATICLIIYGSLYPFHFHARELTASTVWISIHPWPAYPVDTQIKDVVVNLIFYAPLGMFGFLSLSHARLRAVRWGAPIAIGFVLSCCMETLQLFDAGRDSSVLDVVCNTVGSGIGVMCGVLFESWLRRMHTRLQTIRYKQPSSLLLLICLAAYQLSPFFPDYGVYRLQQKLIALTAVSQFSVSVCLVSFIEWLAIARLAETAIDPLWVTRLYLALLMLVPAKILIIGHTTNCAELAGAALAYVIWRYGLKHYPRRSQLLAALFTALIIFRGLSPFQFTIQAMAFSWAPFHALFDTERVAAFTIFFGKLFAFGTFVWLLRDSGWRMRYAAAGAAATLAAIEVAQMFLPGRVPEVADPLLVLLLAWIFWRIDDSRYDATISLPAHAV